MSYYDPDPYGQPEKFGLTIVGEMEWGTDSYSFDLTVVWVDQGGNVYWADDTGCSCPSPFEDIHTTGDLTKGSKWDALTHLQSNANTSRKGNVAEYAELCAKVAAL